MIRRVELLGTPRVLLENTEVSLRRNLSDQALCFLAAANGPVSRDRLCFLFWPDVPDVVARQRLRQLLKRIRRLDWLSGLEVDADQIVWTVATDLDVLQRACERGLWEDLPPTCDLLPGFERHAPVEYEAWLLATRRAVRAQWRSAMVAAAIEHADAGDPGAGAQLLEPLLGEDGEQVLTRYMDLAARSGDTAAALAGYDRVVHPLQQEIGIEPPADARELADRLRDAGDSSSTAPAVMVGRDSEISEAMALLAKPGCRLLTLLGPGGIGKSTLARMMAGRLDPWYADGSAVVALDEVADPSLVPAAIAAQVGARLDGRLPLLDQLVDALRDQKVLLVLDNVEHLAGAWSTIGSLVRRCPQLDVVTTSRERLRLGEEWVYRVVGLRVEEAVELLLARAGRVVPEMVIPRDEARDLCLAVGGSPLGIELAVPMLQVMGCAEVTEEIGGDLDVLSGGAGDTRARHQSVEQAMAHSWRLATEPEREAVEALSVFAAPYSRELAAAVADVGPTLLRRLMDTSLVQRRADNRYASHPLVRQYAASRLATDNTRRVGLRRRHANAVLGLLSPPAQARRHGEHLEDVVTAWNFAVEEVDGALIIRAAEGLVPLLEDAGGHQTGLELLSRASRSLESNAPAEIAALAQVKYGEARLLYGLDRHAESAEAAEAALQLAEHAGDRRLMVLALYSLGWARKWTGGDPEQYRTTLEALPVARELGDDSLTAWVLNGLGCSAPTLEACRRHLLSGLSHLEGGSPHQRAILHSNLGMVCWGLGEHTDAVLHEELGLELARSDKSDLASNALANLAFIRVQTGNLGAAQELAVQAESLSGPGESIDREIYRTLVTGEIRRQAGDLEAARLRLRAALPKAHALRNDPFVLRALRLHAQLLLDQGAVDEGLRTLAFVLSRTGVKGGDFTSEIINPRLWREAAVSAGPERAARAERWAGSQTLSGVVAAALDAC